MAELLSRQEKGRWASKPMPEEHRRIISEAQKERWRKIHAEMGPPIDTKKCNECQQWKHVDVTDTKQSDFAIRHRKNKSGTISHYAEHVCKACKRKKSAAWREEKRRQGVLSELQNRYNANRDPEHRKRYQREYQAMQRRREGIPLRGPWKKYRRELAPHELVPIEPFQDWITERCKVYAAMAGEEISDDINAGIATLAAICGISDRTLRRYNSGYEIISQGKRKGERRDLTEVPVATVDQCLTNEGSTQLQDMYPELYADEEAA